MGKWSFTSVYVGVFLYFYTKCPHQDREKRKFLHNKGFFSVPQVLKSKLWSDLIGNAKVQVIKCSPVDLITTVFATIYQL